MTGRLEALRVAGRWIAKADERLIALDDSLAAVVCFHAQQAVEKLLKALLVFAGVPFARTHDVIRLAQLLPGDLAPPVPVADLAPLNRYAVEARYPIGEEPISGEEARAAIAVSRRVRVAVLQALGRDSPAD